MKNKVLITRPPIATIHMGPISWAAFRRVMHLRSLFFTYRASAEFLR